MHWSQKTLFILVIGHPWVSLTIPQYTSSPQKLPPYSKLLTITIATISQTHEVVHLPLKQFNIYSPFYAIENFNNLIANIRAWQYSF